jgi:TetR/AcrR family transcriptional regulator, repressor for uid operon
MPKLKPETQTQRRDHILDVAEKCFALAGFHRATMADICRQANISPGALYGHFDSKEALIEGLCGRDRAEFAKRFETLGEAPDFIAALRAFGTHTFVEEPAHKRLFVAEMAVESTRNPRIAEIYNSVDAFCLESFERLFARLHTEGRIAPGLDTNQVARVFQLVGDGLFLRRAVHPDFDFEAIREALLTMITRLLNPTAFTPTDFNALTLPPPPIHSGVIPSAPKVPS